MANFNTGKRIYNWPPFMKVVYSPIILWFEVKVIATEFLSLPNDT